MGFTQRRQNAQPMSSIASVVRTTNGGDRRGEGDIGHTQPRLATSRVIGLGPFTQPPPSVGGDCDSKASHRAGSYPLLPRTYNGWAKPREPRDRASQNSANRHPTISFRIPADIKFLPIIHVPLAGAGRPLETSAF